MRKIFVFRRFKIRIFRRKKRRTKKEYVEHKEKAYTLALERIKHFNQIYGFTYTKVTIRNQKTRWGSCSQKGNLNFNYRIALLPIQLADYIIVHELCHLGEFNHSRAFWSLVSQTVPNYKALRQELKKYRFSSLGSVVK